MNVDAEFEHVSSDLFIWHRYDREVKADLFATALLTGAGWFLVDPFAAQDGALAKAIGGRRVAGIVLTNANHIRSSAKVAEEFSVPISAHRESQNAAGMSGFVEMIDGEKLTDKVTVVRIEGAAPGEIALHCASDGGTMIMGDALINFGSNGFAFLPTKYCSNAKLMGKSLRKLLDHPFERLLFAHGMPILTRGRERLTALLDQH